MSTSETNTAFEDAFNTHLNRWNTHSAKWDLLARPLGEDAISLSVADMEFRTAPAVIEAITHAAQHGSYGYTEVFEDFYDAATHWQRSCHGWDISTDDVHFFPRIIECIAVLVNDILPSQLAFNRPPIVTSLVPAYGPIMEVIELSGADIRRVPLHEKTLDNGEISHSFDPEKLDAALNGADLLIWCNPHNPTGRVWTRKELETVAKIAARHDVLVLSDDVHADFTRPERTPYTPLALVSPDLWDSERLIQCASPGKTFTTAGLEAAAIFAPGQLGTALEKAKRKAGLHNPHYFAIPAAIAAWNEGGKWVDALRRYIDANLRLAHTILKRQLPKAHLTDPDGTFLIWVEASAYLTDEEDLNRACSNSAVAVSPGSDFGHEYARHFRINVALPASELEKALTRLCAALRDLR
ncbi:MAG: aminotransferase [Actinobacteria bacterium]|nr:MAG: aminotransferase [Actinomycetota bacterium]